MNKIQKKKGSRILIGALVFVLLMGGIMAPSLQANHADCERALGKCAIDAGIAGLTGGPIVFAFWSSSCLMGYDFCMKYYSD